MCIQQFKARYVLALVEAKSIIVPKANTLLALAEEE
jgi:hypothetical protein